jgi:hydroxylamine dehydrogenase
MMSAAGSSITLRPAISFKLESWERRRISMQDVCSNCHATGWVRNFYEQYEATVDLYNEKFAKPAKSIMDKLYAAKKLTPTPFDEKIEWTYYELWHHQGRRADGHGNDGARLHAVARFL